MTNDYNVTGQVGYHGSTVANTLSSQLGAAWTQSTVTTYAYNFENCLHPYIGALIQKLNQSATLAEFFDPTFMASLNYPFFTTYFQVGQEPDVTVNSNPLCIDVNLLGSPYANYNWELLFHFPLAVAVHLSKNQRFAEARTWFHYIFNPTTTDTSTSAPDRYWQFLAFRSSSESAPQQLIAQSSLSDLLTLLSTPQTPGTPQYAEQQAILAGYNAIQSEPFQPFLVAQTRIVEFQYNVVMKYLDNLIAWGDSLFSQNTVDTLNEATLLYVLAANILGPKPQQLPSIGTGSAMSYQSLKAAGLDPMGNALVELECQFPFNFSPVGQASSSTAQGPLLGMAPAVYFCVPPNSKLLSYWDTVADRLFKLRNCMNIQGVVQQLPLFGTPIDPGLLVQAAAAGIDIATAVSGLSQPVGPVRAQPWIQKAGELAAEVRSLGAALLSAFEKGDAEQLALLRQGQEVTIQQMTQDTRYLQWQQAMAATETLLRTRASTLERYTYYLRLLGQTPNPTNAPTTFTLDPRTTLTEDNFSDAYQTLVSNYDLTIPTLSFAPLTLAGSSSPATQSGAAGPGNLYLNTNEDAELNTNLPTARDAHLAASVAEEVAPILTIIPDFNVNIAFWGIGGTSLVFGGTKLAEAAKIGAEITRTVANYNQEQGGIASKTASYQRRADDWTLQANLAARELMQIGRQIIASLIAEQVAENEYNTTKQQVANAQAINSFLQTKFTNADLYQWMQGELTSLYYQYYRFAVDTARKAEQTMKQELMRPEVDATMYIQPNYWDGGHQGLLSGDSLHFDVKRMEAAFLDNNARELEIVRHVSLRKLDPFALITLRMTGNCQVTIPEWIYDLDAPGLYMRRIKSLALSVPSVVGPYQSVNCTLTLAQSTVRTSTALDSGYLRNTVGDDERFVDYPGTGEQIVTSSGTSDAGLFEVNLRDERFLPFEGNGACSTWQLQLPDIAPFDYMTIADVIFHVRYTARQGGDQFRQETTSAMRKMLQGGTGATAVPVLVLLFSLRHDFPAEWAAFVSASASAAPGTTVPFQVQLSLGYFPFLAQTTGVTVLQSGTYVPTVYAPGPNNTVVQAQATMTYPVPDPPNQPIATPWQAPTTTPVNVSITAPPALSPTVSDIFLLIPFVTMPPSG